MSRHSMRAFSLAISLIFWCFSTFGASQTANPSCADLLLPAIATQATNNQLCGVKNQGNNSICEYFSLTSLYEETIRRDTNQALSLSAEYFIAERARQLALAEIAKIEDESSRPKSSRANSSRQRKIATKLSSLNYDASGFFRDNLSRIGVANTSDFEVSPLFIDKGLSAFSRLAAQVIDDEEMTKKEKVVGIAYLIQTYIGHLKPGVNPIANFEKLPKYEMIDVEAETKTGWRISNGKDTLTHELGHKVSLNDLLNKIYGSGFYWVKSREELTQILTEVANRNRPVLAGFVWVWKLQKGAYLGFNVNNDNPRMPPEFRKSEAHSALIYNHEIGLNANNNPIQYFDLLNSWGENLGENGRYRTTLPYLKRAIFSVTFLVPKEAFKIYQDDKDLRSFDELYLYSTPELFSTPELLPTNEKPTDRLDILQ